VVKWGDVLVAREPVLGSGVIYHLFAAKFDTNNSGLALGAEEFSR
jgi:hypothetical protein